VRLIDDFLIHLSVYATLTLALMPFVSSHRLIVQRLVIGLIVAHSVTTELLQIVIPLRTCDPVDLTANWLGIALGVRLTAHVPQAMAMLQQQQFFIAGVRTPNSLPSNSESGRFSQSNHERQRTS
jgi:hypothetical protein